ncbi:MAG TPA: DUF1800 domain-containing protein [Solirubrobacteraceae bacterium]|nr:DUF1800 domain-containing protein [Solirubrobacteraceae bacterium]
MPSISGSPIATLRGRFTATHATRLLWRAGFGPTPGQAKRLAALGLDGAVASLTRPQGPARLIGRPPHGEDGLPLDPIDVWGDDHCWWLDRMVRSDQQLVERMTLIWHSWFATSIDGATAALMLRQNRMMRARALGNFHDLLVEVTRDPAMLLWLSGTENNKYSPNENYGREVMELFTLGADRGYTQHDVHQQARALTGFTNTWSDRRGPYDFRFDPKLHDTGVKTIFGQRGRFNYLDTCRLCVTHRTHPSFMVTKLWGYFVSDPIPSGVLRALERTYVRSGFEIRPLVEAILRHPLFYEGARMVIPPAVYCAGLLRASRNTVQTNAWAWIGAQTGQRLFEPPNVAGWDYTHWLDTSRWTARFQAVNYALQRNAIDPDSKTYDIHENAGQALARALAFWGHPELSATTMRELRAFSGHTQKRIKADWEQRPYRVMRQNALRTLIPTTPDWQTC